MIQHSRKLPTSMADIQSRYQAIPYGWREIDIAAVVAMLIYQQKVTIKYGGATILPDNARLPDMLRKKSEIGKTGISEHESINKAKVKSIRELLRDYFDVMDVPDDEYGLVAFIIRKFSEQKAHYEALDARYQGGRKYPDRAKVQAGIRLVADILSQQKDNIALIDRVLQQEDALFDSKEGLQKVEEFFKNQVQVFDAAAKLEEQLRNELDYLASEPDANSALNKIRLITLGQGNFDYRQIPELNTLMATVREGHERLLAAKRTEVTDVLVQCRAAIHQAANGELAAKNTVTKADEYYEQKKQAIESCRSLALLDALVQPMLKRKDQDCETIEALLKPVEKPPVTPVTPANPPKTPKIIKPYNRQVVFPARRLESEADIDRYVEKMREDLKELLKHCDGIQLK
jgi:hypothetical protein